MRHDLLFRARKAGADESDNHHQSEVVPHMHGHEVVTRCPSCASHFTRSRTARAMEHKSAPKAAETVRFRPSGNDHPPPFSAVQLREGGDEQFSWSAAVRFLVSPVK